MDDRIFFKLGRFIYRFRLAVILIWLLVILGSIPFLPYLITPFQSTGFQATNSESAKASEYLDKHLGYNYNRIIVLYQSKDLLATQPAFIQKIKKSLEGLKDFPMKHEIIYPSANKNQIAKDKHTAYAVVLLEDSTPITHDLFSQFRSAIKKPDNMTMLLGGEAVFIENVNQQTQEDLFKADMIVAPIAIIILILVFGSIIAALIPVVLGGGCALIILTGLYFLGHLFSLSIFTLNIALLLGLCLSLDYALFIIKRFRDEMEDNTQIERAISISLATAGKAVFFSGLTVFISLSALLLFPVNILFSVGIGGLVAVALAVAMAISLLPALLAVLKQCINALPVYRLGKENQDAGVWQKIAETVVAKPWWFFIPMLILLLSLGYPFLHAKFGISDHNILPEHLESRRFFDVYEDKFNPHELTPIQMVITTAKGDILSPSNLSKLYDFAEKIKKNPRVEEVNSIVTTTPQLNKSQYVAMYRSKEQLKSPAIHQLLTTTTTDHLTVINVVSKYDANSKFTRQLIRQLRQMNPGEGLQMQLTGVPVNNIDVLKSIAKVFPYALLWIMVLTYLVLLVLLRSLFLPLKAIVMTVLSLCASYGVLVFVFQDGHFHQWLNFTPQGMLDISLLVIIFCALFGFSMDYEVFLLTRMQEYYMQTKDNEKSIVFGIVKSSRIISSAAVIVIFICGSFMVAEVVMVKAFGLGIAVAIFVDAFIIRTLFVPATMVLAKRWNWYLPKSLEKILPG